MADDINDERKKMEALRLTNQRLLDEKKLLLLKLQEGEKYKRDLKEAQKGAKKFAAQKEKLQTVLNKRSVDEGLAKEKYKAADAEHDVPEGKRNEKVNESGETLKLKTENQTLHAKNETLILEKERLEEQNSILIQEITNLKTNYERQRKCMELLESENQRLSQIISQQEVTIRAHTLAQEEKGALMKEQLKSYEEDFKKERSEREKLQSENLARQEKLDNANITVEALQKQIRELLLHKNQAQAEPMYPRGPPSPSYVNALPYRDVERRYMRGFAEVDPTYYFHGDRLSSRARGNDVDRKGGYTGKPRAFLSPDMTAEVDR